MTDLDASIREYMDARGGLLTAADMRALGYSRGMLHVYTRAGCLQRYECGFYMRSGSLVDDMVYMQRKYPAMIFSHTSALFLQRLTERTPFRHSITIPTSASLPRSLAQKCVCFYVKPELHQLGLTELRTTMGNIVRGYDTERCICDMLRCRNRVDLESYIAALKLYFSSEKKNFNRLARYAEQLGVMDKLTPYLEVLA